MENEKTPKLKEQILSKIKSGSIKAKPKFHFVLRTLLLISGLVVAGLLLLYLISFVIFLLRVNGLWQAPSFGFRGWGMLFTSLPWMLLILIGFFVLVMEILVKHFSFAYRRPLLYSVLGILVFLGVSGFVVAQTPFHQNLWDLSETDSGLPVAGSLYSFLRKGDPDDWHRGMVISTTEEGFLMENLAAEILSVKIDEQTKIPFALDLLPGDMVMVAGERIGDEIKAFGIREFSKPVFRPRHMKKTPPGKSLNR